MQKFITPLVLVFLLAYSFAQTEKPQVKLPPGMDPSSGNYGELEPVPGHPGLLFRK